MSTVISVRIRKEIKETLEKAGVDISEEVRKFLEELAWRIKTRRFIELWNELLKDVKPSEKGFSVKSVREDRESH
ncbi:MAG: VapB-type antitoxin [Candidatus Aenigmarchaeota archaeon]|nr:VapB-type antitoxin [Candidatus Aenigmarchaeota archaeon]